MHEMNDIEAHRERLLSLAYKVAPELRSRPLYLIHITELGTQRADKGVIGLAGPVLDLACRHAIGDRWIGRGWCIVLADFRDAEGTLLHELAHLLDGNMPWTELQTVSPDVVGAVVLDDIKRHFTDYKPPT